MDSQGSISGGGFWEQDDPAASRRAADALVATVDEGVVRLDAAGTVVAVNDVALRRLGYDRERVVGEHVSVLLDDTDADRVTTTVDKLLDGPDDVALLDAALHTDADGRVPRELRVAPVEVDGEHRGTVVVASPTAADRAGDESPRDDETATEGGGDGDRRRPDRNRDLLDRVFEASPVGICALSPDGELITFNDRAAEILGYEPDGDRSPPDYDPTDWTLYDERGDPIPVEERAFERVVETGRRVTDFEAQVERRDGTRRWLSFNAVPVQAADGLSMVVVTYEDVTDRKERERALERERHQTEQLLDTAPIAIAVQDADGETVRANERAQEFLGLSEHELVNDSRDTDDWQLYDAHGDPLPSDRTPASRVLATGDPVYDEEIAIERPDGDRIWLRVNAAPVRDADGDVERVISAGEDVTELKERERDLARRKAELETELGEILGRVSDAFFAVDEDFRFTHVNDRAHELINPDGKDLVGKNVWEEFPAATDREFKAQYERAMREQETVSFEEYYPDPLDAWFEVRAYPSETGLSVYFRDVTDRKEREERYRALAENFPNGAVTLFDTDFRYTLAGGQAFDDLSMDADDLEGEHVRDVWDEETADALEPAFRAALDGERRTVEVSYAGREWVVYAIPVTDDAGNVFAGMTMAQDVTKQRERERSLRDAKSQLEAAAEAGAVGTWEWHIPEDEFVAGPSFARTFDVDPEAAREGVSLDRFVSAIHEDDRARVEEEIEAAMASCGEYEAEYRVWNADDELRWVVARGHVECDEDGNPVTFPGALTDITERKRAEQELEASEQRYRTLAESFPNGIVTLFDTEREYTLAAGQGFEDIDVEPADVEGRHFRDVWGDDTADDLEPLFDAALAGRSTSVELSYAGREWLIYGAPITDDDGDVFAGVTMAQDITERKEHERELEKYETIVETINDGIYVVDEDGRYTMVNDAYADMTGYSTDELVGAHASRIVDEDTLERASEIRAEMTDGEAAPALETTIRTADGDDVPVEAAFATLEAEGREERVGVVRDITERVKQREKLEKSERRYRTLAEHFPNGAVGVFDHDLRYTLAEGALMGDALPPADRLEGNRVSEVFPEDTVADLEPLFRAAVADGETGSRTTEFGGRIWRVWATPLTDGDDIFAGLSFAQDITEQVEREERLAESERRYRTLAESFPNGFVTLFDRDLSYTLAAGQAFEDIPLDASDVEGRSVDEVWGDDVAADLEPALRDAISGDHRTVDVTYADREWVIHAVPVSDDRGSVFGGIAMMQDVTDRREYERTLESLHGVYRDFSEAKSREEISSVLVDAATDVLDLPGVAVYLDDFEGSLAPIDVAGALAEPYRSLPAVDATAGDSVIGRAYLDGETAVHQDVAPLASHMYTGAHLRRGLFVPMGDHGVLVVGDVNAGAFDDQTVDLAEILAANAESALERIGRERRLRERERELEASNERLEQFAYAASHDLQEPLRMVSSYLSLIERRYGDRLDEDGEEFLAFAVDGAERMREMIDALLEYSRVETRGDPFEPVDLNDVVADVQTDLQVKIEETDADVTVGSLPHVSGDADQLRQVFQNLLDNALQYSGDDPPSVDVTATRDGDEWVVAVSDDGIGIDADHRETVFQVFQRLHTRDEHPGTGIGLALCRRIVERHGGDIWVESDPGDGSTFKFTLPATEATQ